jgi:hypothetical protein
MDSLSSLLLVLDMRVYSPEEAGGTVGFGCDITDVICPAQVVANGDT